MATSSLSLPLHCSVCPKKPSFSDVSHLLTHVASKGHLSHYYKLKVRASQDLNARTLIEQYDTWYDLWDVEDLMAQRMQAKDKKRARTQATAASHPPRPQDVSRGSVVDLFTAPPRSKKAKPEDGADGSWAPSLASPAPKRAKYYLWDPQHPQSCEATPLASSSPLHHSSIESELVGIGGFDTGHPKRGKTTRRNTRNRGLTIFTGASPKKNNSRQQRKKGKDASFDQTEDESDDADVADETIVDDAFQLRGPVNPGMGVWDSATPEMKRKRNQKKDVSVVQRLMKNSSAVEDAVVVYENGQFMRQGKITGEFELTPEPDGQESPPRKRKANARKALTSKDANRSIAGPRQPRGRRPMGTNAPQRVATHGSAASRLIYRLDGRVDNTDRQDRMDVLTSEFRPRAQAPDDFGMSTHRTSFPPGYQQYLPMDLTALYGPFSYRDHQNGQEAFAPYQQVQYGNQNAGLYGRNGYDLPGFYSNNLADAPFAGLRLQDSIWPTTETESSTHRTTDSSADSPNDQQSLTTLSYGDSIDDQEPFTPKDPSFFDEAFVSEQLRDFEQWDRGIRDTVEDEPIAPQNE